MGGGGVITAVSEETSVSAVMTTMINSEIMTFISSTTFFIL